MSFCDVYCFTSECYSWTERRTRELNGFALSLSVFYLLSRVHFLDLFSPSCYRSDLRRPVGSLGFLTAFGPIGLSTEMVLILPLGPAFALYELSSCNLLCVPPQSAVVSLRPGLPRDQFRYLSLLSCQNFSFESLPLILSSFCFYSCWPESLLIFPCNPLKRSFLKSVVPIVTTLSFS